MKFIISPRQSGVTTDLVLEASKFDHVLIVPTLPMKSYVKDLSKILGVFPPETYAVGELVNKKLPLDKIYDISDIDIEIGTASISLE